MILITGWTGNTGSFVVEGIRHKFPQLKVVGISRNTNYSQIDGVQVEIADLNDKAAIEAIFDRYSFEVVINIANIRFSPLLMELANQKKVPHVILVHTTGIYSKYREFSTIYKEIEASILNKKYPDTAFTILRPTMIYGNSRDHNMHKLIRFLAQFPVYPLFGNGTALMQPIHVEDLATAIVSCINNDRVKNNDYDLSGGSVVSYKEILNEITRLLDKKVIFIPVPIKFAIFMASIYQAFVKNPLIKVEQVKRLQEDKAYPHEKAEVDFGFKPRLFYEGIQQQIVEMKKEGLLK